MIATAGAPPQAGGASIAMKERKLARGGASRSMKERKFSTCGSGAKLAGLRRRHRRSASAFDDQSITNGGWAKRSLAPSVASSISYCPVGKR